MNLNLENINMSTLKVRAFTSAISLIALSSCTTISDVVSTGTTRVIAHPNSFCVKNEKVTVDVSKDKSTKFKGGFPIAPAVTAVIAGEVVKGFEKAADNFSKTYSISVLERDLSQLAGFKVKRMIGTETAAEFEFECVKFGDFRFIELRSAKVLMAKAATPFWDKEIDVVCDIRITCPKPDDGGSKTLLSDSLIVRGIKISDPVSVPEIEARTELFPPLKRPYRINVTINEVSKHSKLAKKGGSLLGSKSAKWLSEIAEKLD